MGLANPQWKSVNHLTRNVRSWQKQIVEPQVLSCSAQTQHHQVQSKQRCPCASGSRKAARPKWERLKEERGGGGKEKKKEKKGGGDDTGDKVQL